mmetsp:Transcript_20111/g.37326  ORF Transcript_20111/g.37326 Transcript_20111/m.37326 type:complete len:228 (+) Transcript_20111:2785-3468(+)
MHVVQPHRQRLQQKAHRVAALLHKGLSLLVIAVLCDILSHNSCAVDHVEVAFVVGVIGEHFVVHLHAGVKGAVVLHHAAEVLQYFRQLKHGIEVISHGLHTSLIVVVGVGQVVAVAGLVVELQTHLGHAQIEGRYVLGEEVACVLLATQLLQDSPRLQQVAAILVEIESYAPLQPQDVVLVPTLLQALVEALLAGGRGGLEDGIVPPLHGQRPGGAQGQRHSISEPR